ncbi:hypothetical protein CR203_17475 [Salipaludibacillus neizhouensis]|uniref:Uncharacterized protein n=1 Tax=Salipaludibacillus neizhouensis TaxID=885475 RepID=A0A3A9K6F9_9BACI|nr:hypothetical protein [Salipaludibacillus neizhouensis]RKL66082.1 hypothetical protein CR203_17475 [Salipaludibacillus neizhouensis]
MGRYTKSELTEVNPETLMVTLKVKIEGETEIPTWKDDLKIKAALALLETVDRSHFAEKDLVHKFEESIIDLKLMVETLED